MHTNSARRLAATLTTAFALVAGAAMTAAPASAQQWIDGNIAYASGLSCGGPLVGNWTESQVGGFTGYWGKPDVSYPKVGDLYWGRVYYQAVGLGCNFSLHGVQVEISLPAGTALAIDPNSSDPAHKIRCWGYAPNGQSYGEVTGQSWNHPDDPSIRGKYCEPTVTYQGANGTILSYALVAQGQALEIVFPLRSTRKLSGIGEPNNASRMTATITDSNAYGAAQPYQWNFVGDRPVEPECPGAGTTAASAITNTTAHTRNFMCNWYRSGKVSIEIGEGASGPYQASSPQYNVPSNTQGFYVDQDWNNLIPGTTYHWRLKFVDDRGTAGTADDQTYFSQPKTFTTTGTRPTNPPTTGPGAGEGGTPGNPPADTGTPGGNTGGQTPGGDTGGQQQQQQQIQQQQQQQQQDQRQTPLDTAAPGLTATLPKLKLGDLLKKGLRASANCSEACGVQAQLQIDAKTAKKLKLGKKTTTIGNGTAMSPGGKVTVPVKLTSKAKKQLKRARSLKATLVLTATDPAGNKSKPVKKKLSLKR
jgi:hypothetical protein